MQINTLDIDISFCKKRSTSGRFEDRERSSLGYEGFHQIAIGLRLIELINGRVALDSFIESASLKLTHCNAQGFSLIMKTDEIQLSLCSVLNSDPRRSNVSFIENKTRRMSLDFETDQWCTDQPRQLHLIDTDGDSILVEEDLMEIGIAACVDALERMDEAGIARNQARAMEIELILDRAWNASGLVMAGTDYVQSN